MIRKNTILKKGRGLFNVQNNDELFKIAGSYFASLVDDEKKSASGLGTTAMNLVRKKMKNDYNIDNLRALTDDDALQQLPYSNYIGPGTDILNADQYGPVNSGPASDKNSNNLSADHIAMIHDHAYNDASKKPVSMRFDLIQKADKDMLSEVKLLPESKTKKLIYASILAKYKLENKLGKLLYGGRYFKKIKKGSGLRYIDTVTNLENHIEGIILDKIALPKKSTTAELNLEVETVDKAIKKKIAEIKKEKDLETAAISELNKPNSEANNGIIDTYSKTNSALNDYIKIGVPRKKKMNYILYFPKDKNIANSDRRVLHYIETDVIVDPVTNDTYKYKFPVNKDLKVDLLDFELERDDENENKYVSEDTLFSALQKISENRQSELNSIEIEYLKENDFIVFESNEIPYFNFQSNKIGKIERYIDTKSVFNGYNTENKIFIEKAITKKEIGDVEKTKKEKILANEINTLQEQKTEFDELFFQWLKFFNNPSTDFKIYLYYDKIYKNSLTKFGKHLFEMIKTTHTLNKKNLDIQIFNDNFNSSTFKFTAVRDLRYKRVYNLYNRLRTFNDFYESEMLTKLLILLKSKLTDPEGKLYAVDELTDEKYKHNDEVITKFRESIKN